MQSPTEERCVINTINVFIADDSPIVRARLVTILGELGGINIVGQAATALEAIRGTQELRPDVAILDLHMPGGSGLHVLQEVKQSQAAPVVVIVTNYPYPAYRERCLEAGADFFFDKSTEFDRIVDVLEGLQRGAASGPAPQPSQHV